MGADVLASLTASLALPTEATEKLHIFTYDLYFPKSSLGDNSTPIENLKAAEALETLTGPKIRDWQSCT